ncbi:MAG TPA: C1 family peptidase [Thermomicrobiaceae bacterium]|nr:C1 family peptidase [Thermomicrobiaceae bacterium]
MTYRIRGMGWLPDPPDFRDHTVKDAGVAQAVTANVQLMALRGVPSTMPVPALVGGSPGAELPGSVDLRASCSPIEDQGDIGSCTAHAVCGLIEYLQRNLYGDHIDAARLFLYKVTRSYLGWTGDTGAFVRSTIKALRLFGVPPEDAYPYATDRFDDEPSAFAYAFAGNYKAIEYHRLDDLRALKQSLAAGMPLAFGFTCYQSIFNDDVRRTGTIPLPRLEEKVVGGHAVMAVGYDDAAGCLLLRNSWGPGWGDAGYGTLPYEYVDQGLAQDFWALAQMDVVPIEREP